MNERLSKHFASYLMANTQYLLQPQADSPRPRFSNHYSLFSYITHVTLPDDK